MEVRAQARAGRARASPAATSSIAARLMPTAGSSSTPSTATRSRSTPTTGKEVWRTKLGDINSGETMTMAPLVVKGKVLVGNSGGEYRRARLAHRARCDDRQAWSGAPTAPDPDARRADRPDFKPFYDSDQRQGSRGHDLAAARHGGRRRHGVGLDLLRPRAESDLLRHRQSRALEPRAAPGRQQMDGRHLRARCRHRRGALVLPDSLRTICCDYDGINEIVLLDLHMAGSRARCWCGPTATAIST